MGHYLNTADQTFYCQKRRILHLEQIFGVKGLVQLLFYFSQLIHQKKEHCFQTLNNVCPFDENLAFQLIMHAKTMQPCFFFRCFRYKYRFRYIFNEGKNASGQTFESKAMTKQLLIVMNITLVGIQTLVMLLNFECSVVEPGRCFCNVLSKLTRSHGKPHPWVMVTNLRWLCKYGYGSSNSSMQKVSYLLTVGKVPKLWR